MNRKISLIYENIPKDTLSLMLFDCKYRDQITMKELTDVYNNRELEFIVKKLKKLLKFRYKLFYKNSVTENIKSDLESHLNFKSECMVKTITEISYQLKNNPFVYYLIPFDLSCMFCKIYGCFDLENAIMGYVLQTCYYLPKNNTFEFKKINSFKINYDRQCCLTVNKMVSNIQKDLGKSLSESDLVNLVKKRKEYKLKIVDVYPNPKNLSMLVKVVCRNVDYLYFKSFIVFMNEKTKVVYPQSKLPYQSEKFDEKATEAINKSLSLPFSIISGEAGTGKTEILKEINSLYEKEGVMTYTLSFTGISVDNIKKRYNNVKYNNNIMTIDKFIHSNCMEIAHVIIIDEISMLSIKKMAYLVNLFDHPIQIILVGDMNQLKPVDYAIGLFDCFKHLMDKLPYTELVKNYRIKDDTGVIIKNAKKFLEKSFVPGMFIEFNDNFKIVDDVFYKDFYTMKEDLIKKQIICKKNITVENINNDLQEILLSKNILNNNYIQIGKSKFYEGDKIICKKNGDFIFNGSMGVIQYIGCIHFTFCSMNCKKLYRCQAFTSNNQYKELYICEKRLKDPSSIKCCKNGFVEKLLGFTVEINKENHVIPCINNLNPYHKKLKLKDHLRKIIISNDFSLGYCITCHKYQGSQAKEILYIIEDSSTQRSHFYTSITRAEEKVFINNYNSYVVKNEQNKLEMFSSIFIKYLSTGKMFNNIEETYKRDRIEEKNNII